MATVRKAKKKSFRLDPDLVAEARRAIGAKDETEAVRIAPEELLERAHFRKWVKKVAGKGTFPGYDACWKGLSPAADIALSPEQLAVLDVRLDDLEAGRANLLDGDGVLARLRARALAAAR